MKTKKIMRSLGALMTLLALISFIIIGCSPDNKDDLEDIVTVNWNKIPDVAQYGDADWSNEIQRVQGITVEEAKKIGESDSNVTFFFYVKKGPVSFGDKGVFQTSEAVFFSGDYWWGSAKGIADSYLKNNSDITFLENYEGTKWVYSYNDGDNTITWRIINNLSTPLEVWEIYSDQNCHDYVLINPDEEGYSIVENLNNKFVIREYSNDNKIHYDYIYIVNNNTITETKKRYEEGTLTEEEEGRVFTKTSIDVDGFVLCN